MLYEVITKLSEMEVEYPDHVSNRWFEIRIENDELIFDYKLSEGVTKTMNATFLMRKMGIIWSVKGWSEPVFMFSNELLDLVRIVTVFCLFMFAFATV